MLPTLSFVLAVMLSQNSLNILLKLELSQEKSFKPSINIILHLITKPKLWFLMLWPNLQSNMIVWRRKFRWFAIYALSIGILMSSKEESNFWPSLDCKKIHNQKSLLKIQYLLKNSSKAILYWKNSPKEINVQKNFKKPL